MCGVHPSHQHCHQHWYRSPKIIACSKTPVGTKYILLNFIFTFVYNGYYTCKPNLIKLYLLLFFYTWFSSWLSLFSNCSDPADSKDSSVGAQSNFHLHIIEDNCRRPSSPWKCRRIIVSTIIITIWCPAPCKQRRLERRGDSGPFKTRMSPLTSVAFNSQHLHLPYHHHRPSSSSSSPSPSSWSLSNISTSPSHRCPASIYVHCCCFEFWVDLSKVCSLICF